MGRLAVTLLALLVAAAGCISISPDDALDAVSDDAGGLLHWALAALESAHDHTDPELHRGLTTPNFELLGHEPLISADYGTTVQGNLCGDAYEFPDGRRLAAIETRGDIAFSIADVTDPAAPQWLGEFVMRTTYVYDLAVVADGKHVALVTSNHKTPDRDPVLDAWGVPEAGRLHAGLADGADGNALASLGGSGMYWRSACAPGGVGTWHGVGLAGPAEELLPRPNSLILVSIEDPSNPVIVDQRPILGPGHGVFSRDHEGRVWVVASALGCVPNVGCPPFAASYHFYEIASSPLGGARLEFLSVLTVPLPEPGELDRYPERVGHNDAWIITHPVTKQVLAYLSAWDIGLLVVDVTDPRNPEILSRWTDFDPALGSDDSGSIHSAHPMEELWNDRHYVVIGPELGGAPTVDRPTGIVRVLDTTDPRMPFEVAAWTLPHDVVWEGRFMWSPHFLVVQGQTAFVSMYHGGIWALDLAPLNARASEDEFILLDSIGVFLPVGESPSPPENPFRWAPTLQEVYAFSDGTLLTFEANTGLYTFRFDESRPMAPPEPWVLEPADALR